MKQYRPFVWLIRIIGIVYIICAGLVFYFASKYLILDGFAYLVLIVLVMVALLIFGYAEIWNRGTD